MMKFFARVFAMLILLLNIMPFVVFAADVNEEPNKPYEKVVAKSGDWFTDQIVYDGDSWLVSEYTGNYNTDKSAPEVMEFKIDEKIVLRGIYIPFTGTASESVTIQLVDNAGNIYKNLPTTVISSGASENKMSYGFTPENDIVLPEGRYSMTLSNSDGLVGAFLIKGVNYSAYEKYKKKLQENEADGELPTFGNEENFELEKTGVSHETKPIVFMLDSDYHIDEIIINTYNDGKGAIPGTISVVDNNGKVVLVQQAYGGSLGEVANGIWTITPNNIWPAGNYSLVISEPKVISYDKSGEPLFYVKASLPLEVRYDFTGTYSINFDAYKTSTLMGSVSGNNSSILLKNFEISVLDKGSEIELIGKYEGMPFSQNCEIIEETENTIIAKFDITADLSKLPYKARIGANTKVTLTKTQNEMAQISIKGTGTFEREASREKGADYNTYSIISEGKMLQRELPPFVLTALGKSGGIGNIPGADNAMQVAVGILFPPLTGVIVNVLQELLKPKPKVVTTRDKSWYKSQNPNLSDEELAMVMLADAMGNTDNPDEGDAVSVGDNEISTGTGDITVNEAEYEASYEEEPDVNTDSELTDDKQYYPEKSEEMPATEVKAAQEEIPKEEVPQEPEEMVLQTSANGATTRYVKDTQSGQWIDAETGSVLDYEKYKENAASQFAEDKRINDEEFEKSSKGETDYDRTLRDEMKKISDNQKWESYKDSLKSRYGTDNLETINGIINDREKMDRESFEKWQMIGDVNAVGETGATVVGTVADTAIDGLSEVTPGGNYIKAGYKVTKGIAGTMAEEGVSTGSFVEGAIKGGADAATDFIDFDNPLAKAAAKATVTVAGESGGSAAGAYIRGEEDWQQAGVDGMVDGVFKAGVGAVTDGLTADAPEITTPTMKNVIINKTAATKIGSSLADEYVVKPKIVDPIKDSIKNATESKGKDK